MNSRWLDKQYRISIPNHSQSVGKKKLQNSYTYLGIHYHHKHHFPWDSFFYCLACAKYTETSYIHTAYNTHRFEKSLIFYLDLALVGNDSHRHVLCVPLLTRTRIHFLFRADTSRLLAQPQGQLIGHFDFDFEQAFENANNLHRHI